MLVLKMLWNSSLKTGLSIIAFWFCFRVSAISSKPRESCMQRWLEMLFGSIARLCDASPSECFEDWWGFSCSWRGAKLACSSGQASRWACECCNQGEAIPGRGTKQPNQYLLSNELAWLHPFDCILICTASACTSGFVRGSLFPCPISHVHAGLCCPDIIRPNVAHVGITRAPSRFLRTSHVQHTIYF